VTGRYFTILNARPNVSQFQSSPGLVTGRYTKVDGCKTVGAGVSILARSGDRALRSGYKEAAWLFQFQSSPGLVTGRYPRWWQK